MQCLYFVFTLEHEGCQHYFLQKTAKALYYAPIWLESPIIGSKQQGNPRKIRGATYLLKPGDARLPGGD
jgi:hypothetical protein